MKKKKKGREGSDASKGDTSAERAVECRWLATLPNTPTTPLTTLLYKSGNERYFTTTLTRLRPRFPAQDLSSLIYPHSHILFQKVIPSITERLLHCLLVLSNLFLPTLKKWLISQVNFPAKFISPEGFSSFFSFSFFRKIKEQKMMRDVSFFSFSFFFFLFSFFSFLFFSFLFSLFLFSLSLSLSLLHLWS